MRVEEVEQRRVAGEVDASPATGAASRRSGRGSCTRPSAEQVDLDAARRRHARRGRAVGRPAHLDQQHAAGQLAREVHDDGLAVGQAAVDRGGDGGRGVHDDQVAGARGTSPRSAKRACDRRGVAGAHEQPDVVAPAAATLRAARGPRARGRARSRARRTGVGRWCVVSIMAASIPPPRRRAPRSGRSGGRPRSGRAARARSRSGSGRSEMSSPGNASWCISVRMSPGSTTRTRRSGRSTASTRLACSSAAFDAP